MGGTSSTAKKRTAPVISPNTGSAPAPAFNSNPSAASEQPKPTEYPTYPIAVSAPAASREPTSLPLTVLPAGRKMSINLIKDKAHEEQTVHDIIKEKENDHLEGENLVGRRELIR